HRHDGRAESAEACGEGPSCRRRIGRYVGAGQSEPVGPSASGKIHRQNLPRLAGHRGKKRPGNRDDRRIDGNEPFASASLQHPGRRRTVSSTTSAKRRHLFQGLPKASFRKTGQTIARPIARYGAPSWIFSLFSKLICILVNASSHRGLPLRPSIPLRKGRPPETLPRRILKDLFSPGKTPSAASIPP